MGMSIGEAKRAARAEFERRRAELGLSTERDGSGMYVDLETRRDWGLFWDGYTDAVA